MAKNKQKRYISVSLGAQNNENRIRIYLPGTTEEVLKQLKSKSFDVKTVRPILGDTKAVKDARRAEKAKARKAKAEAKAKEKAAKAKAQKAKKSKAKKKKKKK